MCPVSREECWGSGILDPIRREKGQDTDDDDDVEAEAVKEEGGEV